MSPPVDFARSHLEHFLRVAKNQNILTFLQSNVPHHSESCGSHIFELTSGLEMVELRKRKAHIQETTISPRPKKRISSVPITAVSTESVAPLIENSSRVKLAVGDIIDSNGFGGDISTQTGENTTLKNLLESSQNGVILFTYPKASTPGCTFLFLPHLLWVS